MRRVVDNRTFLLGLDKLYREAMKPHERSELLDCARQVAAALQVGPADVPIEGYYTEDARLTEYFRLMRSLQKLGKEDVPRVASLDQFQRLRDVTSSPIYGRVVDTDTLLPGGRDSLSQALDDTKPNWSIHDLVDTAYTAAVKYDDFSLVGLAACSRDVLVLAATRESVVLYAELMSGSAAEPPKYIWNVEKELAEQARRFIDTFNRLFGERLPPPEASHAATYWHACEGNEILGRCVRLGFNDAVSPVLQYHWAICSWDWGRYAVQEFWHPEVWTTARYRAGLGSGCRCPGR